MASNTSFLMYPHEVSTSNSETLCSHVPYRGPRGVPMLPVDFKKCQCRMSLPLIYAHVEFKK